MTPAEFARKWMGSTQTERAAWHEHFIDLCRMLGVPTPNEDPTGHDYAFEKGAEKVGGGGFADVWKRGHFAWEYKGKRQNLATAYQQLLQYREALEALVISGFVRGLSTRDVEATLADEAANRFLSTWAASKIRARQGRRTGRRLTGREALEQIETRIRNENRLRLLEVLERGAPPA